MKTYRIILFLVLLLTGSTNFVLAQQLVDAEYFFDTDPGVGNGTSFSITAGNTLDFTANISTTGLAEGYHTVWVRFQDLDGTWSFYEGRTFLIGEPVVTPPTPQLVNAEYFFDTDPGVGNGTSFSITAGNTLDFTANISTTGLAEGYHTVWVRFQDLDGTWSFYEGRTFLIREPVVTPPTPQLVNAEYFFDTDPGVGNGTSFSITAGNTLDFTANISTTGLAEGYHTVWVRFQDLDGTWSFYEGRTFFIQSPQEPDTCNDLISMEYFIDSDPGIGNGTPISVPIAETLDLLLNISTIGVDTGQHFLFIRVRDECGIWSLVEQDTFFVFAPPLPITVTGNDPTCNGLCNGDITATPIGGTVPFTFQWDDPGTQITQTATGLCAGIYNVTVIDADGSQGFGSITINDPPPLLATITTTDVSCNSICDGTATVIPGNGTGPFTFQWDDPGTQITQTAIGLCAGVYNVTVIDANGCVSGLLGSSQQQFYIPASTHNTFFNRPPLQDLTFINDGNFGLVNGTIWQSTPSTFELTMTFPSSVILDEVRVAGGQFNGEFNIPPLMELHRGSSSDPLLLTVTPPVDLNLNNFTFSNTVSSVNYTWVITSNPNGFASLQEIECFGSSIVPVSGTVNEPVALSLTASATDVSCIGNDGTATVSVIGGTTPYSFLWDDPLTQTTSTATGLIIRSYLVEVTDANGCIATETAIVGNGCLGCILPPTANAGADATICESSTHTLAGSIGGSAANSTWSTSGTGSFDNVSLLAATYTPSPADVLAGSVTLTLTTDDPDGAGPCVAAIDATTLTIDPVATVNAGADATICEGSTHTLAGAIGGSASSSIWSSSGSGGFDNTVLLAATYTPSAADILAGSVTLTLTTDDPAGPCIAAVDAMTLTIDLVATSNAGADATVCEGNTHILAGSIGGSASSSTWTTSGTGGFDNAALLAATYTPSAADILAGSITLTLTTDDPVGPCVAAVDAMTLTIDPVATSNAGADATICEGGTHTLAGTIGGSASSSTWTSSGSGVFDDNLLLAATYTPSAADILAGSVTLTLTTDDPAGPCVATVDAMTLTIDPVATSNAGADVTICEGGTHTLAGAIGGSASSSTWSTSGTGGFDNPALLAATYTPSAADILAGSVTLTLTTDDPVGPCVAAIDAMTLTIDPVATSNAGADATICEGGSHTLAGAIGGSATSSTWSTSGTGTFDNAALLAATYTPSPADILVGSVTLTLTTDDPVGSCVAAIDAMTLTIDPVATSNSGADATICEGGSHTLAGAIGGNASSSTWSTSGTGGFDDVALLGATYTPSPADIIAGSVTLTLTTDDPAGSCVAAVDAMTLTIDPIATSNAGVDATICEGSTHTLAGAIGGSASSSTWSTSGTGTFDNAALLAATYTPSAADILAGSVNLTLTTDDPPGPCVATVDAMTLTIDPVATANAGADVTICEGSAFTLSGAIGGSASNSTWTSSGSGVFDDNLLLAATYTPSAADILASSVTLTLTTDDPAGSCVAAVDAMTLTIDPLATANAGADATICEGSAHTLAGAIGGSASTSTWSTSGTGGFDDAMILAATYTPSAADILVGSVILTLTTDDPAGPCVAAVDAMSLTIDPLATANAGADATICEGSAHTLAAAIGGSASTSTWSTSGTGAFDNAALLAATYTPSPADIIAGSVTLTLTTDDPAGPCVAAVDAMTLTIEIAPTVDAGLDKVVVISPSDPAPPSPTPCVTLTATTIGGTPPYTYAWSPITGLTTPNSVSTQACPTITTLYTVTVTDANGCIATDQVLVTVVITTDVCTDLSKIDLSITNSVSNLSPNVGEPFNYIISASNYGPNTVDYVYIKDAFDPKIWCGTWSLSVSSPPGTTVQFNCGADLPCFSGGQIASIDAINTCVDPICANTDEVCLEITDLAPGDIVTFTISGVEVCSAVPCSTVVDNKAERVCTVPDDCISNNDDPNAPIVVNPTCAKLSGPADDQDPGMTTNLMDLEMQNTLTIFPNPNSGEFTLIMLGKNKQVKTSIYLYNALGAIVYESENVNHHFMSIDISSYSKGVYMIKVIQGDRIYTDKILYQ